MNREQALRQWLNRVLGTPDFHCLPLQGDASLRRYYRVQCGNKHSVVMDAPPPEAPALFMEIASVLFSQGLSVPKILASDLNAGFLLLSDLGDQLYLNALNENTADVLYNDAFEALLKIQHCKADVPVFDQDFLIRQWGIFEEWYLKKHKKIQISEHIQTVLYPIHQLLVETIALQPKVFVHRDYHSRNLMILEHGNPGVLDFQDAMLGPITYDLVSLLQDCYIAWPRDRVLHWVEAYRVRAIKAGLLSAQEKQAEFVRWFDWTGLQRHLKNLGIFSRLHYRDNKSLYLKDIPQVIHYISETCRLYPELYPLGTFIETLETQTQSVA